MISIREVHAKLNQIGQQLRAGDFKWTVLLVTHDSIQCYDNAIASRWEDWLLVWTEHHGYHVEHVDEIKFFRCTDRGQRFGDLPAVTALEFPEGDRP